MHELLHIGILTATLLGAAGTVLVVLWPLFVDQPLPSATRVFLLSLIGLGGLLLLVEWRFVH